MKTLVKFFSFVSFLFLIVGVSSFFSDFATGVLFIIASVFSGFIAYKIEPENGFDNDVNVAKSRSLVLIKTVTSVFNNRILKSRYGFEKYWAQTALRTDRLIMNVIISNEGNIFSRVFKKRYSNITGDDIIQIFKLLISRRLVWFLKDPSTSPIIKRNNINKSLFKKKIFKLFNFTDDEIDAYNTLELVDADYLSFPVYEFIFKERLILENAEVLISSWSAFCNLLQQSDITFLETLSQKRPKGNK